MSRIDDILSGGPDAATNPALKPLVNSLSSRLNVSQEIAEQVVSFAAQQVISGQLSGTQQASDHSSLAHELARKAKIDPQAAADGLKHVLENFGRNVK